jgi:hypothetical protein
MSSSRDNVCRLCRKISSRSRKVPGSCRKVSSRWKYSREAGRRRTRVAARSAPAAAKCLDIAAKRRDFIPLLTRVVAIPRRFAARSLDVAAKRRESAANSIRLAAVCVRSVAREARLAAPVAGLAANSRRLATCSRQTAARGSVLQLSGALLRQSRGTSRHLRPALPQDPLVGSLPPANSRQFLSARKEDEPALSQCELIFFKLPGLCSWSPGRVASPEDLSQDKLPLSRAVASSRRGKEEEG